MKRSHVPAKQLAEIGVALALAVVLGMIRIYRMPQGGSVSLEMVPIFYIALKQGVLPGILTGLLYGVLQLFLGAYIVHPFQLILDYPLAYGLIGFSGLLQETVRRRPVPSMIAVFVLLGSILRLFSHLFSGVIFFSQYAPESFWGLSIGGNPYLYSFLYNISFLLPEALITIGALIFLRRVFFLQ